MIFMNKYVDGFVLVVPKDRTEDYKKMAEDGRDTWMKYGALAYFECRGDDYTQNEMEDKKTRSFTELAGASDDEDVWFSFIIFKSKEHRDEVNAKVFAEMGETAKEYTSMSMPFDMNKLAYGGFKVEVDN